MRPRMRDVRQAGTRGAGAGLRLLAFAAALAALAGAACDEKPLPGSGAQLYVSPQMHPVALSGDGSLLYVANTTSGTLSVVDVSRPGSPREIAEIKVGHDPTGVAVRPEPTADGDEIVLVTNHISDTVSVVSRDRLAVVQTVQQLDPDGVTQMDEPVGVVFADPWRAFVTLGQPNQVLVLDVDADGHVTVNPQRLDVTAQAPRALTVANGLLYVASFESGNQTELPMCAPGDPRGLLEDDTTRTDEGCELHAEIIQDVDVSNGFNIVPGDIFRFAAMNPNIGGRVIRDTDIPDRDLFVYDATTLDLVQVVEGVSTLLQGLAAVPLEGSVDRLFVTSVEARNELDGLRALDNHLFENRLSWLDCGSAGCGPAVHLDLDVGAGALSDPQTLPSPYGIAASGDGRTLVVTASRADGDPGDGRKPLHGLFTLGTDGEVLGSALVGALPEGVALRSAPDGTPLFAFVLNTADSTLSVVDVRSPRHPRTMVAALPVGSDPTPEPVRLGRIGFEGARGSTSHTFGCGSCHPNGNIDQLLWVINTVEGPDDGPAPNGDLAEPRNTMPIRGLRDTLPLHWEGNLGDPFPGVNPNQEAFDTAPDCGPVDPFAATHEPACMRHLVDAALGGPNCQHNRPGGCAPGAGQEGPGGALLPGALTETERDAMSAYLLAVAFPPAPGRRPTDELSPLARGGVSDFFTNEDGMGINNGIGQAVNFAPSTCADNPMGCHSLPLTVSTNSSVVGGFDAPSARGMWDRFQHFSNGIASAEEMLRLAQDCADGIEPPSKTIYIPLGNGSQLPVVISGDPCNLNTDLFPILELPFPSGETVYDPAVGMTERGSFMSTFETLFRLVYGVEGTRIWAFQEEIGTGLPGLTGRQVTFTPANANDPDAVALMDLMEQMAAEGRITAVATRGTNFEMRFDPVRGLWSTRGGTTRSGAELRAGVLANGLPVTVTADLPENVSIGGIDRQPLLFEDPALRSAEVVGDAPSLPRPPAGQAATFRLGARYVLPGASVLVNGALCDACSFTPDVWNGEPVIDLTLSPGLPAGVHVLQVQNPSGWASNEMPLCVTDGVDVCL